MGAFASIGIGLAARFLISLLTPKKVTEVGKLDDTNTQKSQFGAPIPIPYGKYRYEGLNVFWSPKLFVKTKKEKQGGKGGGSKAETKTYLYSASFACLVCDTRIAAFLRVWVNGKVEYNIGHKAVKEDIEASTEFAEKYLRFFHGQPNMTRSPDIVAVEGNNIPAFRNRAYLVFDKLPLEKHGNRIPKVDCEVQGTPWRYIHGICESGELVGDQLKVKYSKFSLNDKQIQFDSPVIAPTDIKKDSAGLTGFVGDQTVLLVGNDIDDPCCPIDFAVNTSSPLMIIEFYSTNNAATLRRQVHQYQGYGSNLYPPSFNNVNPVITWLLPDKITTPNANYNPASLTVLGIVNGSRTDRSYTIVIKSALAKDCANNTLYSNTFAYSTLSATVTGKILRVVWVMSAGLAKIAVIYTQDGTTELSQIFAGTPAIAVPNIANEEETCQTGYLLQTKSIITYQIEAYNANANLIAPDVAYGSPGTTVSCETLADTSITVQSVALKTRIPLPDDPEVWDSGSNYPVTNIANPFGITHNFAPNSKYAGYELELDPIYSYHGSPILVYLIIKQKDITTQVVSELVRFQVNDNAFFRTLDFYEPYLDQALVDFDLVSQGSGACTLISDDDDCDTITCGLTKSSLYLPNYINIRYIVRDICRRAGLKDSDFDVCRLNHQIIGASMPQNDETFKSLIEELQKIFFFISRFENGKLTFVPQTNVCNDYQTVTITEGDLGAREITDSIPELYDITTAQANDLPTTVILNYKNGEKNHQPGSQIAMRDFADHVNSLEIQSPLALSDGQAKNAVLKTLRQMWTQRVKYTNITLLPRWIDKSSSGTHLLAPVFDTQVRMQVGKRTIGANYLVTIETTYLDQLSLQQETVTDDIFTEDSGIFSNPKAVPLLLDINLINDSDSDSGVYAGCYSPTREWSNGTIQVSQLNQNDYSQLAFLLAQTVTGSVNNALPSASQYVVDYFNTITVQLHTGTLSNATNLEFSQLSQIALVGSEIIGFKNATLIGLNTYELSGLQRGLYGTERARSLHYQNELFVLLRDPGFTERATVSTNFINDQFDFKCVAIDQELDDVPKYTLTYQGNSLKPYNPVNPTLTINLSANLQIFEVKRRTRKLGQWSPSNLNIPLNEASEEYDWVFYSGSTIVSTKTTTSPKLTYTNADIIADFGTLPTDFTFKVYQISQTIGRGYDLSVNNLTVSSVIP